MLQVEQTGQAVKLIEHQQGGEKEKERVREKASEHNGVARSDNNRQ